MTTLLYEDIFVMGPPGSGKDTQCKFLKKYGYCGLRMSEELERLSPEFPHTDIRAIMDRGDYVPSYIANRAWNEVRKTHESSPMYHNGTIRTADQAFYQMSKLMNETKRKVLLVNLELDRETILQRIRTREEGRKDDHPEVIQRRLQHHFGHLELIHRVFDLFINLYPERIELVQISAKPGIDDVRKKFLTAVGVDKVFGE